MTGPCDLNPVSTAARSTEVGRADVYDGGSSPCCGLTLHLIHNSKGSVIVVGFGSGRPWRPQRKANFPTQNFLNIIVRAHPWSTPLHEKQTSQTHTQAFHSFPYQQAKVHCCWELCFWSSLNKGENAQSEPCEASVSFYPCVLSRQLW